MMRGDQPTFSKHPLLVLQHALTPYTAKDKASMVREGRARLLHGAVNETANPVNDSPVGLLAWIYEKLHYWADSHPWTDDEIFTWVGI
jgi:hypothetical protein